MAAIIDYGRRRGGGARGTRGPPSTLDDDTTELTPTDAPRSRGPATTVSGSDAYADDAYTAASEPDSRTTIETPTANGDDRDGPYRGAAPRDVNVEQMPTKGRDRAYRREQEEDEPEPAFFDPTFPSYQEQSNLEMPFFNHVVANYGEMGPIGKARLMFRQALSFGLSFGGLALVFVLAFVAYFNPLKKSPARAKPDREYERRITGERLSGRPEYYSEFWGYQCDRHEIVTEGGWILYAHRVSDPRRPGPPGHPVILQHGILCNSSHFFVNEERSMAFWLVDQGYDVWVTNIRANFHTGHTEFTRFDPRFWAWGLKELAYDLRDVVEFICGATGKPRVAYVGHSQGSGSMYLALSPGICPELGNRLSCYVALGPSVYAGPMLRKFPFSLLRMFRGRRWWSLVFGVKEFIPALAIFQKYLPAFWFGHIGYVVIGYLFGHHDHNWLARQKPKFFRTVPVPTSSELLYWYMASFSHRGCIFDPRITQPWFPPTFPPHSVVYGDIDYLVVGKPLIKRIEQYEKNLNIVHAVELEGYEHLDMIFGIDAYRTCFPVIKDTIESTLHDSERPQEMTEYTGTETDSREYEDEYVREDEATEMGTSLTRQDSLGSDDRRRGYRSKAGGKGGGSSRRTDSTRSRGGSRRSDSTLRGPKGVPKRGANREYYED